jgi:CMP-N-acetylneuraminic acid synthetase
MNKTISVIIHARTQSTRVPNKHLRDLGDGKTLIDLSLELLSKIKNVDEKYLAVHEDELKERVVDGVEILHREYDAVAPGNASHDIMYKHLENVKSDYIVNLNPCQPFLDIEKIQSVIDWFKITHSDSAITVKKTRNFYWDRMLKPLNFLPSDRLSTTSGPFVYEATHSLVFYKKDYMLTEWQLFSNTHKDPETYVVDWSEEELLDVDTEFDFEMVKNYYQKINGLK